ncbi:MAG TPA: Gfo/Idh/MocA family oxidoreductase [Sphingobium sp.]
MNAPLKLGIVGYGKIAHDQHVPAIAANPDLELVAVASPHSRAEGLRNYSSLTEMLAAEPDLDAVVMAQPPQVRYVAAREALLAGKHVFLEKPPGATLSEVEALIALADERQVSLFASWHSRYAACVAATKAWIATHDLESVAILWKEDVRHWHPGQHWIWQPGGFGVFDPGINALSILTEILPQRVILRSATLETPVNCHAPIAAELTMETTAGIPLTASFDFRQPEPAIWDIMVKASGKTLVLGHGGNRLAIDDMVRSDIADDEYPTMYRHFVKLVRGRVRDVDLAPLHLVADAFLHGRNSPAEAFVE